MMSANELEFQRIYDTFQSKILRYLTHLAGEQEAEDLAQETFVKIHQGLENFRGKSQLSTWVYRIATNTALDRLRSPSFQRVAQTSLSEDLDETELADKVICAEEKKPLIEKLPESYRTALVLSEWEGLKNNKIAEILGVTLDTVKIRLHRAREILKEELRNNCDSYWIEDNEFLPELKAF